MKGAEWAHGLSLFFYALDTPCLCFSFFVCLFFKLASWFKTRYFLFIMLVERRTCGHWAFPQWNESGKYRLRFWMEWWLSRGLRRRTDGYCKGNIWKGNLQMIYSGIPKRREIFNSFNEREHLRVTMRTCLMSHIWYRAPHLIQSSTLCLLLRHHANQLIQNFPVFNIH